MKNTRKVKLAKDALAYDFLEKADINSISDLNTLVQELTKKFIEKSLDAELENHLGYKKWDQKSRQVSDNYRNGYTKKKVKDSIGEIEISSPRDKHATFEPLLVKKRQSTIDDIENKIITLFAKGNSTRDISDIIMDIYNFKIDKNFVSKVTDKILQDIINWQKRPLEKYFTFLNIDGIRFRVNEDGEYKEKTVYICLGTNYAGFREVLGFWIGESESAKFWITVFSNLQERGLKDVLLVTCDNLSGISRAIKTIYSDALVQKCVVHQIRNSLVHVTYKDRSEFTKDMKKIYQSSNRSDALQELENFALKWKSKYPSAITSWRKNFDELTQFFELPSAIKKAIYTNNTIENLNRKIRKNTKTKGGLTSTTALKKLIFLVIKDYNHKVTRRTHNWASIYEQLKIYFPNRVPDYDDIRWNNY